MGNNKFQDLKLTKTLGLDKLRVTLGDQKNLKYKNKKMDSKATVKKSFHKDHLKETELEEKFSPHFKDSTADLKEEMMVNLNQETDQEREGEPERVELNQTQPKNPLINIPVPPLGESIPPREGMEARSQISDEDSPTSALDEDSNISSKLHQPHSQFNSNPNSNSNSLNSPTINFNQTKTKTKDSAKKDEAKIVLKHSDPKERLKIKIFYLGFLMVVIIGILGLIAVYILSNFR
jgi:ABC-type antimicrobial peptide transport system permease subunit